MEKLITVKEVSQMLRMDGKHNKFIYEATKKGLIPCIRLGNKLLFKEADVVNFVERQFKLQNK